MGILMPSLGIETLPSGHDDVAQFATKAYEEVYEKWGPSLDPELFPPHHTMMKPILPRDGWCSVKGSMDCMKDIISGIEDHYKPYHTTFTSQMLIPHLVMDFITRRDTSIFHGRCITMLSDGRRALVPASTRPGDVICILLDDKFPHIVRPYLRRRDRLVVHDYENKPLAVQDLEDKEIIECKYIGTCFVEGIMYGEASRALENIKRTTVFLIQ
jgi:hypothetical protein